MYLYCLWPNKITQKFPDDHDDASASMQFFTNGKKTVGFKMFLSYTSMFINPIEEEKNVYRRRRRALSNPSLYIPASLTY